MTIGVAYRTNPPTRCSEPVTTMRHGQGASQAEDEGMFATDSAVFRGTVCSALSKGCGENKGEGIATRMG